MSDPLKLEAIYYPRPIPRGSPVLTVMGLVFDKVYFPGVYFPTDGYDPKELDKEIARLDAIRSQDYALRQTTSMLRFIRHAKTLSGFCEFSGSPDDVFGGSKGVTNQFVDELFDAIHGPRMPGWKPLLESGHHKSLHGNEDAFVAYPGNYHYLAGAIIEAGKTGLPLVNDDPHLPIPLIDSASPADNAAALVTLLAIHCTQLVLPTMKAMQPDELMEFRDKNATQLRSFRRAMLRHAGELNDMISGLDEEQIDNKTAFYVQTKILPELDELREAIKHPARTWADRASDAVQIAAEIGPAYLASAPGTAIATALAKYAPGFFAKEIGAELKKREKLRRSHLYYLIEVERAVSE